MLDKILNKKLIIILLVLFILVTTAFLGFRIIKQNQEIKYFSDLKDDFFVHIDNNNNTAASEIWPEVYTYYRSDEVFLTNFSDILFEAYTTYYIDILKQNKTSEAAFYICRDYYSFLETDSYDMVVSGVYDDYLNEHSDYRTFINSINDLYLFSGYNSPKVVELLDKASVLYESRQSYLLGESYQRTEDYNNALKEYRNVIPADIIYYPLAIEKIDECIQLLKQQVLNGSD